MILDVVPEGGYNGGPGGGVNAEEPSQSAVQLELHWLIIQQQQQRALDILVTGSFNLYVQKE